MQAQTLRSRAKDFKQHKRRVGNQQARTEKLDVQFLFGSPEGRLE
jgi:hypothetical protein